MKNIVVLFFFISINSFSQVDENLYYCNDNAELSEIFILDDNSFIGYESNYNSLLLFDKHRLVVDTLKLGSKSTHFLQHVQVIDAQNIYVDALNAHMLISISEGRFHVEEEISTNKFGFDNGFLFFSYNGAYFFQKSIKNKKNKINYSLRVFFEDDEKWIDLFSPFYDLEVNKYLGSNKLRVNFYFDKGKGKFYLPVESIGKIVTIDVETKEISNFNFPEYNTQNQSWYLYYDYVEKDFYGVLFNKNGSNELFWLAGWDKTFKHIKSINFIPRSLFGGNIIRSDFLKESGKQINCFYLIPVSPF